MTDEIRMMNETITKQQERIKELKDENAQLKDKIEDLNRQSRRTQASNFWK